MSKEVRDMFCDIASRYDLANDLLSLYTHRAWKNKAFSFVPVKSDSQMLDLCCGTGDFTFTALNQRNSPSRIVGVDLAPKMIEYAKKRFDAGNYEDRDVEFLVGDALSLPFDDNSFDCVTVGFGVRNFDDPLLGLKEIARVLKIGGTLLVLEFGEIESKLISLMYTPYAAYILPLVGGWVTGNREAYKYLHRTSLSFPGGKSFLPILEQAGLSSRDYRAFCGGIAYAYTAAKN